MGKLIERDYTMEDWEMLQLSQVIHNAFAEDKADFVADFPHLDDPFAQNMQTAIDEADAIPSGDEVDSEIAVVTNELNTQLPLGWAALQRLYTYVDLAWGSKAMDNAFGRNRYVKARRTQMGTKSLLEFANRQAEKTDNKTELLAVGYTQSAIEELKTIAEEIEMLHNEQEDMFSDRWVVTERRLIAYNAVWGFMKQINKASKVTYVDSPAKICTYMLYSSGG